jgi:hypothetical protein
MSGGLGMEVAPDTDNNEWTTYQDVATTSPRLDFNVNFTSTGQFWIFIRGDAHPINPGGGDTCWSGLDGQVFGTHHYFNSGSGTWAWVPVGPININSLGTHLISVWAREDGFTADKIVVKNNQDAMSGNGPAESSQQ